MAKAKKKIFVAMSGGVDSSVAAYLLKKQGHDVTGVFMRSYNLDGCSERDAEDARRVASHLNVPFYVFDFEEEYKKRVVEYMIDGYRRGITPNPDVMCNKEIKFGLFLKKALELGADYIATGHYARLINDSLFEAKDKNKDQSYFLWVLTQEQLKRCLFPIGDYLKPQVRAIARKAGLPTAEKRDSQGICFLGKVNLADFLKKHIPEKRGAVLTTAGEKIGEHDGAEFYTIGQRHIGVSSREPIYVTEKNLKNNTLVVAAGEENQALYKKEIELSNVNFINPTLDLPAAVFVRVRYRQPLMPAVLKIKNSPPETDKLKIEFDRPVKFIAPGQSAVFYGGGGELLGGGVILLTF